MSKRLIGNKVDWKEKGEFRLPGIIDLGDSWGQQTKSNPKHTFLKLYKCVCVCVCVVVNLFVICK